MPAPFCWELQTLFLPKNQKRYGGGGVNQILRQEFYGHPDFSGRRVRGVVNMGGVVKTLRRSNSLFFYRRSIFSTEGSFGFGHQERQPCLEPCVDTARTLSPPSCMHQALSIFEPLELAILSVATPAEPRGEKKLFFVPNFGR